MNGWLSVFRGDEALERKAWIASLENDEGDADEGDERISFKVARRKRGATGSKWDVVVRYTDMRFNDLVGKKHCHVITLEKDVDGVRQQARTGRVNIIFNTEAIAMEDGSSQLCGTMTTEVERKRRGLRRATSARRLHCISGAWSMLPVEAWYYFVDAMAAVGYFMDAETVQVKPRTKPLDEIFSRGIPDLCSRTEINRQLFLERMAAALDAANGESDAGSGGTDGYDSWSESELENRLVIVRDMKETKDWLTRLYAPVDDEESLPADYPTIDLEDAPVMSAEQRQRAIDAMPRDA